MDIIKNIIVFIIVGYIAICILMFAFQRSFIYFPSKNIESFESYGLDGFKEIQLKTGDNVKIIAWYKRALSEDLPVIVMFHAVEDRTPRL